MKSHRFTISGGTNFTSSAGTITISNNGTYTGISDATAGSPWNITGGTVADTVSGFLSGTISIPTSGTNTATINNSGSGRNFTVNLTVAGTFGGVIMGAGAFTLGGASTNTLTLSGANAYGGGTNIAGSALTAASNSALSGANVAIGIAMIPTSGTVTLNFTSAAPAVASLASSGAGTSKYFQRVHRRQRLVQSTVRCRYNQSLQHRVQRHGSREREFHCHGRGIGMNPVGDLGGIYKHDLHRGGYHFMANYTSNPGFFDVDVTPVPEPATWFAGFLMFGSLGFSGGGVCVACLRMSAARPESTVLGLA